MWAALAGAMRKAVRVLEICARGGEQGNGGGAKAVGVTRPGYFCSPVVWACRTALPRKGLATSGGGLGRRRHREQHASEHRQERCGQQTSSLHTDHLSSMSPLLPSIYAWQPVLVVHRYGDVQEPSADLQNPIYPRSIHPNLKGAFYYNLFCRLSLTSHRHSLL